ncbi:MAG: ParA family protein [Nanoarchaeota archaeon]
MRKIAVINQKGGVGKTTSAVNIAYGLSEKGYKVLLMDLDGQGNIASVLHLRSEQDMYSLLVEGVEPAKCMLKVTDNLSVITSNDTLEKAEMILAGQPGRETILSRMMAKVRDFDFVFLDCPPSVGLLNHNALLYADEAFIPVSTDYLGVLGLKKMLREIETVNDIFSHKLRVTAIIPTMYDQRNKTCKDHLAEIKSHFDGVVTPPIRSNSKLKEFPQSGKPIFEYAKYSRGAKDYQRIVDAIATQLQYN